MRYLMPACVLVVLGLLVGAPQAGEKKGGLKKEEAPTPPWASVTLGGEVRDLIELRGKVNVGVLLDQDVPKLAKAFAWEGPPPKHTLPAKGAGGKEMLHVRSMQVGKEAWVVTLLDDTHPELDKVLPKLRSPEKGGLRVIMTGRLAAAKDRDPFVAHAKAWGTLGDEDYLMDILSMGQIRVVGKALPGKHEISKGKVAGLAIENGWSPIIITGKAAETSEFAKGTAIAVLGKLVVSKGSPLVVEAASVSPATK